MWSLVLTYSLSALSGLNILHQIYTWISFFGHSAASCLKSQLRGLPMSTVTFTYRGSLSKDIVLYVQLLSPSFLQTSGVRPNNVILGRWMKINITDAASDTNISTSQTHYLPWLTGLCLFRCHCPVCETPWCSELYQRGGAQSSFSAAPPCTRVRSVLII